MSTAPSAEPTIRDESHLEDLLSQPTPAVIETCSRLQGDVLVLGVGGKMGPSLSRMIRRAFDAAGVRRRVIGVSRFGSSGEAMRKQLEGWGVETVAADLLDQAALDRLPDAPNIVYMAGMKFGSTGQQALTWAMNTYLPGRVCERFPRSRIVAFSTGNVYAMAPVTSGGATEEGLTAPVGEYGMSTLGRERLFEHFSRTLGVPVAIIRLNYAVEMRYGVLTDIARRVWEGEPVDVSMGVLNAIWQGDANAHTICALDHVASPSAIFNVTGPELMSVRALAERFGQLLEKPVHLTGQEAANALISNAQKSHQRFGYPTVPIGRVIEWTADWVRRGGSSLNKPTHFETRDGKY